MRNSNISRDRGVRKHWRALWTVAALALLCLAVPAYAIDPHRSIAQYSHDVWGDKKGFPGGSISAIAQTADGYLWIGTEKGLIRFDGLNFRVYQQAVPESFPIGPVVQLETDSAGNLWVLLQSTKILRFNDGKFELGRDEAEFGITAIGKSKDGAVLFTSLAYGALTYKNGKFEVLSSPSVRSSSDALSQNDVLSSRFSWATGVAAHRVAEPNTAVLSIVQTTDGKFWLGTHDKGLFYMNDGRVSSIGASGPVEITCLLPLPNGELWVGSDKGIFSWNGTGLTQAEIPPELRRVHIFSMIRDHDSNVWVGTANELIRVSESGVSVDVVGHENTDAVTALFEGREGNVWVGRADSIERVHETPFITFAVPGTKSQSSGPIFVDADGRTWFAPFEGGLRWLKGNDGGSVTNDGLDKDVVYSISGNKNELWIGRQRGGLTRLRDSNGSITTQTFTQANGLAQNSAYAVHESDDGTVWVGTLSGGVSKFKDGHFTIYTTASGLAADTVSSITESRDGTMWFGTPKGVSAFANEKWKIYTSRDGLPSDDINCLLNDSNGVLWIGTANGLAFLQNGQVHALRNLPDVLREPTFGIAEDKNGWLWIATAGHVLQVNRSSLMGDKLADADVREYGIANGLKGTEGVKRSQSVVEDSQGQIWFSTNRGVAVVNPARPTLSPVPALIHIDAVVSDGNALDLKQPIQISASQQRTTIRFAGLSLSNPERVRYRYLLEGFDKVWSEPVTTPEATYANLSPGKYRFRVMASNSDGLWNGPEATISFAVVPTLWQNWWFRLLLVLCLGLVVLAIYRLRMHELARILNVRFEERLAERTRIAQDLHDTLLQGVLSASMQLHVAVDQLPDDSPARPGLDRVLQLIGQVVEEGRNTLRGLRASVDRVGDLESSFSSVPQEVGAQSDTDFRVIVEGTPTPLRPVIRDDVYSIGREALVNAFRHSGAATIEVELEYRPHELRMQVRDNGRGIDPQVLYAGRDGHWGLSGMRERAERIGAKLKVWSSSTNGTEVDLRVPGRIAFGAQVSGMVKKSRNGKK